MCKTKESKPISTPRVPVSEEVKGAIAWQNKVRNAVMAAQSALNSVESLKRDVDDVVCDAIAAWLLAGETPTARGWLGGALIVAASLCAAWMETGDALE